MWSQVERRKAKSDAKAGLGIQQQVSSPSKPEPSLLQRPASTHHELLMLEQPRSHIPLYEADYEAMKQHKEEAAAAARAPVSAPSSPRASQRVRQLRDAKLPARPGQALLEHERRNINFVSVSPFDSRFPVLKKPIQKPFTFSCSPFDADFPVYRKANVAKYSLPRPMLDSDDREPVIFCYSPWDANFPHFTGKNRKSRNRSAIKRRRIQSAMAQFRRERGPVASRPIYKAVAKLPVDPSTKSYSPWDEVNFALACGLDLKKLVSRRNLKKAQQELSALVASKKKAKKPRYISYSPWDKHFPSFSKAEEKPDVKKASSVVPVVVESKRLQVPRGVLGVPLLRGAL